MTRKRKASQPASPWHLAMAVFLFFVIIAGLSWSDQFFTIEKDDRSSGSSSGSSGLSLTLYSSPDCSCCHNYVDYLEGKGYSIDFVKTADYLDYFEGVPDDMYSCHIVFGEGYYTVGHIPEEALSKLFSERPWMAFPFPACLQVHLAWAASSSAHLQSMEFQGLR